MAGNNGGRKTPEDLARSGQANKPNPQDSSQQKEKERADYEREQKRLRDQKKK